MSANVPDGDGLLLDGVDHCPSYPKSTLQLENRWIDEPRRLRVAVIGAGLAGVLAGILLPVKVPSIELTIYEKNEDISGTWVENIYPGVRCDIPAHVYQSTFAPNSQWSEEFAEGSEIRKYWQDLGRKYDVYKYLKLASKVEALEWDAEQSVWKVQVKQLGSGEVSVHDADVVLNASGRFNAWRLPDYPGIAEYQGLLRHASDWDPNFSYDGKAIAVIGNGASGIQVVTNLQPHVKRLDHYARNKTWIAPSFGGDERLLEPQPITKEQRESFSDPEAYLKYRKAFEDKYWRNFRNFFKGSKENEQLREKFAAIMTERVRPTPGPGYLEALTEHNVDFIQTPIKRFTKSGIETIDCVQRDVDAVFCRTGANIDMIPPFPIRALGVNLQDAWRPEGQHGFPYTYMGLATPGFPNLLFVHGPHGTGASGTVPQAVEAQLTYFAKLLRKMASEGIKTVTPLKKAADDFVDYCDAFFAKTALSDNCSSWYNSGRPGGRIHGVWPGSAAHVTLVRREPRWEDYEYDYLSDSGNRFVWYFGNGWTKKEQDPKADITSYLKLPSDNDLRDIHERWWDWP